MVASPIPPAQKSTHFQASRRAMKASLTPLFAIGLTLLPATAFAAKPDLTFSNIDGFYDPATDLVNLELTVKNAGDAATNHSFFVDVFGAEKGNWDECAETATDFASVPAGLQPGAEVVVELEIDRDFTQLGPLYFFVDIDELVFESDEGNNEGLVHVLDADPNEPVVTIGNLQANNPQCLRDTVFNAFGVMIGAVADVFYSKLRILP